MSFDYFEFAKADVFSKPLPGQGKVGDDTWYAFLTAAFTSNGNRCFSGNDIEADGWSRPGYYVEVTWQDYTGPGGPNSPKGCTAGANYVFGQISGKKRKPIYIVEMRLYARPDGTALSRVWLNGSLVGQKEV